MEEENPLEEDKPEEDKDKTDEAKKEEDKPDEDDELPNPELKKPEVEEAEEEEEEGMFRTFKYEFFWLVSSFISLPREPKKFLFVLNTLLSERWA